jgi:hypothetical protein
MRAVPSNHWQFILLVRNEGEGLAFSLTKQPNFGEKVAKV